MARVSYLHPVTELGALAEDMVKAFQVSREAAAREGPVEGYSLTIRETEPGIMGLVVIWNVRVPSEREKNRQAGASALADLIREGMSVDDALAKLAGGDAA